MKDTIQQCTLEQISRYIHDKSKSQLWSLKLVCEKDICTKAFISLNSSGSNVLVYLKLVKSGKPQTHSKQIN